MTVKRLIGPGHNQVPMNRDLGTMAFQDSTAVQVGSLNASGGVTANTFTGDGSALTSVRTLVSGTTQASTSGTSIDFTGIPSWAKRVTIMFNGVSTNGTSNPLIQIGAGSIATTGYSSTSMFVENVSPYGGGANYTTGFGVAAGLASNVLTGTLVLTLLSSNTWVMNGALTLVGGLVTWFEQGSVALGGALDRVRITTVSGADSFDAGSINIMYE